MVPLQVQRPPAEDRGAHACMNPYRMLSYSCTALCRCYWLVVQHVCQPSGDL